MDVGPHALLETTKLDLSTSINSHTNNYGRKRITLGQKNQKLEREREIETEVEFETDPKIQIKSEDIPCPHEQRDISV